MAKLFNHSGLLLVAGFLLTPIAQATSFNISNASTTKQSLAAGDTGTVTATGSLSVTGNNVAVTVTGNSTFTNDGTIQQTSVLTGGNAGNSRAIRDNTGNLTLTVNNGSSTDSTAKIETADADVIQMNKANSSVTLNNYGILNSQNSSGSGNQTVDWTALNTTTGNNTLNNFATGKITATNADAVRTGVNGVVNNDGLIKSTASGSSSDGVDAQNNTGAHITNSATGTIEGGRHGITGAAVDSVTPFTATVTNSGIIKGDNGSGINLDGFNANQTATVVNHGTITGTGVTGDGDGIDVDGLVNVTNTGIIRSVNAVSGTGIAQSEGISVGGGTIINSGTIEGLVSTGNTNAVGRGISLLGNDITTGPLTGTREAIYGNATITNQAGGLIRGQSDSGIAVDGPASGFTVNINNNAGGIIQGGGASTAAIQTGADNDTITNAGTINGTSSGKAIDMGAGNNTLNVQGGDIQGNVSGGTGGTNTLNFNVGNSNSFAYGFAFSNFNSAAINSGLVSLNGANTYTGITTVNANASLGGNGSLTGTVDVKAGGTAAAGNSIGTLNTGDLLLESGAILKAELDGANGLADLINVTGSVSLDQANLVLVLLSSPTFGQTFDILRNDGNDAITGTFIQGHLISAFFGGHAFTFEINYAANTDSGGIGNDIRLTAVPTPATSLLLGLGGLMLFYNSRRRYQA